MANSPILDAALLYASWNLRVLPVRPKSKIPALHGWPQRATTDHGQIVTWFKKGNKNLGIATGRGLVVIDIDGPEEAAIAKGLDLPPTLQAKTARGWHLYYSVDGPVASTERQGLELSGEGRQILAPPSIHPSGHRYVWVDPSAPIVPLPAATLEWFRNGKPQQTTGEQVPEYLIRSRMGRIADRAGEGCNDYPPPSLEDLDAVAIGLPNTDPPVGWNEWNRRMMAFYADAPDTAYPAAVKWSAKNTKKFHEEDCAERWEHYGKSPPTDIHFGTLVHLCQEADPAFWLPSWGTRPDAGQVNGAAVAGNLLEELNKHHAVIGDIGGKCRIMSLDRGTFQTTKDFSDRYMNRKIGKESLGSAWLKWNGRNQYEGIELNTNCSERRTPNGNYNLWRGFAVESHAGRWSQLQAHIRDVLAGGKGDDAWYIVRWVAWAIQNPGKPAEVALVLKGGKGVGKGMFASALIRLFGKHGLQINSSKHLVGNFNAHLRDCLMLFADEAFWAGDRQGESALKRLLTESTLAIEPKGLDVISWPNRLHVIMAANADWIVPASHDERRYAVFDVADSHAWDRSYFSALAKEIESEGISAMLHDLQRLDLKGFHPRDIPFNAALHEQRLQSLPILEKFGRDVCESGVLPGRNGSNQCSVASLYEAFQKMPDARRVTQTAFGIYLRDRLGAVKGHTKMYRFWAFNDVENTRAKWKEKYPAHKWQEEITEWL